MHTAWRSETDPTRRSRPSPELLAHSLTLRHTQNTLAPYASSYKPPIDSPRSDGPVHVTLALGVVGQHSLDEWEEAMDWEELVPNSQDVLDAVRHLRDGDGLVDMQVDLPWELGTRTRHGDGTVVVVDTNILISHLPLIRDFVQLCSSLPPVDRPTLLVPHIVLRELDGLKNSARATDVPVLSSTSRRGTRMTASISALARAATNWLLSSIDASETPSIVRGQRKSETLFSQHALRQGENNDSLVLDAAAFFVAQSKRVVLLSDDNNLRLRAKFEQVEAMPVDAQIGTDASKLLAALDPFLSVEQGPKSPPSASNKSSRTMTLPPDTPRAAPSSSPTLSKPKATPIPLPSTIARSSSMHLDPVDTVPLHPSPHPPTLLPPATASSIFSNLLILFAHFLALPLYKTVYSHFSCLPDGATEQQRQVLEELGDWREWDAVECARVIKRWWEDGGIRQLCVKGYEKLHPVLLSSPPRAPPPAPTIPAKKPLSPPSRLSRWASAPSSSSPPRPDPPPIPSRSNTSPAKDPSMPASVALSTLHSTLPYLTTSLALAPASTLSWSSIRFEVLLESLGNWLVVLLSGILAGPGGVRGEVERLVQSWRAELRKVGVEVGTVQLGMC
ncbi:hypothetical protein JCM11491_003321 [Sporobolomyces phaffii]